MSLSRMLVFDMDGVLVDVTESYRETIQRTVEHFTGKPVTRAEIQDWKNRGGWNDDWRLSQALIRERGRELELQTVIDYFQAIFHGENQDGLILRERWVAANGRLERLAERFRFAVFTGRMRWEAEFTLRRFAGSLLFDPIIGMQDVANLKPAPDGLLRIAAENPGTALWYIGDTVDDARSSRAAGVPFIGIAAPANPRHAELRSALAAEGAIAVLDDINQLEDALPL